MARTGACERACPPTGDRDTICRDWRRDVNSRTFVTSFLTSLLSAFTRRWTRTTTRATALLGILASVPAVVWEASSQQRITFISEHVHADTGYTVEECLATPNFWRSIAHPDDRDAVANDAPFRCMTKDGRAIWVESRVTNDGTRGVTVESSGGQAPRLPRLEYPEPVVANIRRKHVLVVDRDEASIAAISDLLKERGARVTAARSATEAILSLHVHYDLVITDVGVVVADGVTLAQQLRQANGGLPAIVLRKPLDPAALATEIAQALNR